MVNESRGKHRLMDITEEEKTYIAVGFTHLVNSWIISVRVLLLLDFRIMKD